MMACNLLPTSLSHRSCHKDEIKGWIFTKTSVHGSSKFSGCVFDKAYFAARSASSFPLISLWLGSLQNVINLPLDNIFWHACKTLFTRGFLLSWLSMACNNPVTRKGDCYCLWQHNINCQQRLRYQFQVLMSRLTAPSIQHTFSTYSMVCEVLHI